MLTRLRVTAACTVLAGLVSTSAPAAAASCSIGNGFLSFGNIPALTSTVPVNATGSFTEDCTLGTAFSLSMDKGLWGLSISSREMKYILGTAKISYQMYQDAAHSIIFGDGVTGSKETGHGQGFSTLVSVYGQIPSQNISVLGFYDDSLTITVTY